MLRLLGFIDVIGSILILTLLMEGVFLAPLVLIIALILIIKSFLNIISLAGMIDFVCGIFLLSKLTGVNLGDYSVLLVFLFIGLFLKGFQSILR